MYWMFVYICTTLWSIQPISTAKMLHIGCNILHIGCNANMLHIGCNILHIGCTANMLHIGWFLDVGCKITINIHNVQRSLTFLTFYFKNSR